MPTHFPNVDPSLPYVDGPIINLVIPGEAFSTIRNYTVCVPNQGHPVAAWSASLARPTTDLASGKVSSVEFLS